ncbi:Stonustoxin subunit alpha [Labeo rohita]|uniref:Stonustoxin subunit alpha n=1 Tax=Labeo rohita TaxID=84645 RepID=A0ABQ8L8X7_LABRO|nr:Stonustoxin subunit alpha [Labeo rohita]
MPRKKTLIASSPDEADEQVDNVSANTGSPASSLSDAVAEITANISKIIEEKMDPISQLLQMQRSELDEHKKRITETETRISAVEDVVTPIKAKIQSLEKLVHELGERADDLENRGRRKNICIVGLPEGVEGDNPTRFFESWLPKTLCITSKAGRIKLERAHRSLAPKPSSTQRPRPVLVRFHNFQDKQRVLNAARELGINGSPLKFGDSTMMIFRTFLRLFSVTFRGSVKVFHDPAAVEAFLDSLDVAPVGDLFSLVISLCSGSVGHGGESRITAGLKKYACFLTLDPNTANKHLSLSEENRNVTHEEEKQSYSDHPDRFDVYQVLCRESVCGRCYWEIEWSGHVLISVSYKSISRKGRGGECWFGFNDQSWSLSCSHSRYSFRHNNRKTVLPVEPIISNIIEVSDDDDDDNDVDEYSVYADYIYRLGVYVDVSAGTLSFYSVSRNTMSLIHTEQTTFTQPLYPGFSVGPGSLVKLC